jgi:hypothetical protein
MKQDHLLQNLAKPKYFSKFEIHIFASREVVLSRSSASTTTRKAVDTHLISTLIIFAIVPSVAEHF